MVVVGVPREVKSYEGRVAVQPDLVGTLCAQGHRVLVESDAGTDSHLFDDEYREAGAEIVTAAEAWGADLVMKVKEPQPEEYHFLRPDQVLFTYLHLAADRPCTEALLAAGTTSLAYEEVVDADGGLPLLAPMSRIAGRLATQVGAETLLAPHGGRGVLLGAVPGSGASHVVVFGAGMSGSEAAEVAVGLGADVTVFDKSQAALDRLSERLGGRGRMVLSTPEAVAEALLNAELVIGAVLVRGARAPIVVTSEMVETMPTGSVLVDIAVDQGGCFADTRPTTLDDPVYRVGSSLFYCVSNMPAAVPRTSTEALTHATGPYVLKVAEALCEPNPDLLTLPGLTTSGGKLYSPGVAEAHGMELAERR
ncbi:alanine dehydrogenase [Enemella sp. A6]|uniref:alanine dehydrogenase n=1 Tax=Enemella sp. A6 TaxID=3440152 RepID=UPI003EB77EDC